MPREIPRIQLTPKQFELEVKQILEKAGAKLDSFAATHRQLMAGDDGQYEIDVTVRFGALGADFVVLVECKQHRNPIKREVVQVLHDRIRSTGAHKGIIFATAPFQQGALEYARRHGIALVRIADGDTAWETKSLGPKPKPPLWADIPPYVGWLIQLTESNLESHSIVDPRHPEYLIEFLGFPGSGPTPSHL